MFIKRYCDLEKLKVKKITKNILCKVIKKKKLLSILKSNKKKTFINKLTVSDASGCIDIFSTAFINIRVGDLIQISEVKHFYYRNCSKIIGFFSKAVNLIPFNDNFTENLEKNHSKKKYKIFC
jgi:hypothetical protein